MALGSWVELHTTGQWLRTRLTWQNPQATMFVFTGVDGSTHSMTRRVLDIRLAAGAVRIVDRAVVDSALDAVAKLALLNSLDISALGPVHALTSCRRTRWMWLRSAYSSSV